MNYKSRSAHRGHNLSKADDLESLLLLALCLDHEHAHWTQIKAKTSKELNEKILESKEHILSGDHLEILPTHLQEFAWEVLNIKDASKPDYDKLI